MSTRVGMIMVMKALVADIGEDRSTPKIRIIFTCSKRMIVCYVGGF